MTDNEIIKALECCFVNSDCTGCPAHEYPRGIDCLVEIGKETLDLINRQKAEIERLKETPKCIYAYDGETMEYCVEGPCGNFKAVAEIKSEAIKEFAEMLKERACISKPYGVSKVIDEYAIDNLVKEMTEGV